MIRWGWSVDRRRWRRRLLWRIDEYVRAVCEGERWEGMQAALIILLSWWVSVAA